MYDTVLEDNFRVTRRLTNKEKRLLRKGKSNQQAPNTTQDKLNFTLRNIEPLTINQQATFANYEDDRNMMLHGYPGTGKSFLAVYLALREILTGETPYKKLMIIRSAVAVRDIGFLPGKPDDKIAVYEKPYVDICTKLFNRGDAYKYLKQKDIIEFAPTSFIRANTLDNCIVFTDEMANCTFHELDSVITRAGKNCKMIFAGDFRQSDFIFDKDKSGLHEFMKVIKSMRQFQFIEFNEDDIVRSGLVKAYIIAKIKFEDEKRNRVREQEVYTQSGREENT